MNLDKLNDVLSILDRIQGLPAAALVLFGCIVIGYVLRFIKAFPNNAIPVVVILSGSVLMLILADPRATAMPARIWTMRNLLVGLIIGFAAWMLHYYALAKIEDWIGSKFNLGNTDFFRKSDVKPNDTPKP